MPFLLLLVLTLVSLQSAWPEPPFALGPGGSALVAGGWVLGFVSLAGLVGHRVLRQLGQPGLERAQVQRRYVQWRRWHFLALLLGYLAIVFFLGWGWTASWLCTSGPRVFPLVELVLLAPLSLALALGWARFYDADKALYQASLNSLERTFPGRWTYVWLQARTNLILVLPPLVLLMAQQTIFWIFPTLHADERVLPILGAVLLAAMFVTVPWLLRILLGLTPLPNGPLRDRLLATALRVKFRCSNILVWDTRHSIANALVTGPLPWLRYVVLTDRLIAEMTPEETEAVFGHEIGHVKHHHMFLYFFFMFASLMMLGGLWTGLMELTRQLEVVQGLAEAWPAATDWLATYEALTLLPFLAFLGLYGFVVFGFLSRRCERQADIFGCRTVSCQAFISALEKVAVLNGISRDRPGLLSWWLHSTIGLRVAFLERMAADAGVERRFQRSLALLKLALVLGLIGALAAVQAALAPDGMWTILSGSSM